MSQLPQETKEGQHGPKVVKPPGVFRRLLDGFTRSFRNNARWISNGIAIIGLPSAGLLVLSSDTSDAHGWVAKIDRFVHSRLHLEWFHLNLWDNAVVRIPLLVILAVGIALWFRVRIQLDRFGDDPLRTTALLQGEESQPVKKADGKSSKDPDGDEIALIEALIADAARLGSAYGTTAIALLAELLAEPKTYIHRLGENVQVGRQTTARSVEMDIFIDRRQLPDMGPEFVVSGVLDPVRGRGSGLSGQIRAEAEPRILFPLAQQEKGRMYEHMEIGSKTDDQIVALSYGGSSMAAYVAILAHIFSTTYGLPGNYSDWSPKRQDDPKWKRAFNNLVTWATLSSAGIIREGIYTLTDAGVVAIKDLVNDETGTSKRIIKSFGKDYVEEKGRDSLYGKINATLNGLTRVDDSRADPDWENKLRRIVKIGITHYVITVQCRPAEYLNITYSYSHPTATLEWTPRNKNKEARRSRRVRRTKLSDGQMLLSMNGARYAKSYHMDISVQEPGSYIQQAYYEMVGDNGGRNTGKQLSHLTVNPHNSISVSIPYLRKPTVCGAGAHIYGRHLGRLFRNQARDYETRIEKPPQVIDDNPNQ